MSTFNQAPIELDREPRYALSGFIGVLLLGIAIIPVLTILYGSLSPYSISITALFDGNHPGLTVEPFRTVLGSEKALIAASNSVVTASVATVVVVAAAVGISWIVNKSDLAYKRAIDYLSFPILMSP